jgi:hypothetical protein
LLIEDRPVRLPTRRRELCELRGARRSSEMASMDVISMRLTARQWATVDATMDNAAQAAIDRYEDDALPVSIREAGWAQVPWVGDDRSWPPDEQIITIALSREQWDLVVTANGCQCEVLCFRD